MEPSQNGVLESICLQLSTIFDSFIRVQCTIAISGQNRHFCSFQPQNTPQAPACPRLDLISEDVFVNTFSDFIQFSLGQADAHSEKRTNRLFFPSKDILCDFFFEELILAYMSRFVCIIPGFEQSTLP